MIGLVIFSSIIIALTATVLGTLFVFLDMVVI